jgi:hypothetical protein
LRRSEAYVASSVCNFHGWFYSRTLR